MLPFTSFSFVKENRISSPVHAFGESFPEKCLRDVAVGMDDGTHKVLVVYRLQDDLHVALEEPEKKFMMISTFIQIGF